MSGNEFQVGAELTHILVVSDLAVSVDFYRDILGAEIDRTYGGTSAVLRLGGSWLLLVTGGGPTPDKPTVTFTAPDDVDRVAHAMTFRVADCVAAHDVLRRRGANFLSDPIDNGPELRCFLRDPDGHLLELSQVR